MRDDGRRARIAAAVTGPGDEAGVGVLMSRLCRFAADEMTLSGCAVVLISGNVPLGTLGGAGRHAATITELQFELGEGPACRPAHPDPGLLPDWQPSSRTMAGASPRRQSRPGVRAEFSACR